MHITLTLWLLLMPFFSSNANNDQRFESFPGHLNSQQICYTELGKARIFFYMTPEKEAIAREFVKSINNNNLILTTHASALPCPVSKVVALVTKYPSTANYDLQGTATSDSQGRLIYPDPIGNEFLNHYARKVIAIAEQQFGINIKGLSRSLNLNLNQDALKIHQIPFTEQYCYLNQLSKPVSRYVLFQDLTLIDWQMAAGTLSGNLIQDGECGDRFLITLFPGQILGAAYMERMAYDETDEQPISSKRLTFAPQVEIAPIEYFSNSSVGSWKGKNISTRISGIVLENEFETACTKATLLPIHRPLVEDKELLKTYSYPNGIVFREVLFKLPKLMPEHVLKLSDRENLSILEFLPNDPSEHLKMTFQVDGKLVKAYRLIKKGGGFSHFKNLELDLPANGQVVIVNHSCLPEGYHHFIISEDYTQDALPWIQMYRFPPHSIMQIPLEVFTRLSLTPVEEILYRNEIVDAVDTEESHLLPKLTSKIDLFVFSNEP